MRGRRTSTSTDRKLLSGALCAAVCVDTVDFPAKWQYRAAYAVVPTAVAHHKATRMCRANEQRACHVCPCPYRALDWCLARYEKCVFVREISLRPQPLSLSPPPPLNRWVLGGSRSSSPVSHFYRMCAAGAAKLCSGDSGKSASGPHIHLTTCLSHMSRTFADPFAPDATRAPLFGFRLSLTVRELD